MIKPRETNTPQQDRLADKQAKSDRLVKLAERPDTPWLVGKLARAIAWSERPTRLEHRLAVWTDDFVTRAEARSAASREHSEIRFQAALGRYRRVRDGEPASDELLRAQFDAEQGVARPEQDPNQEPLQQPDRS